MTVFILDSFALLHRVYHALPKFTDKEGNPTGALYGFCSVTLKVLKEYQPDVMCAAFDTPEQTFREEMLAEYHANRPETADDFKQQIEPVKRFLRAMRIPVFAAPGFEGDDVLGTLVMYFRNRYAAQADIRIVTGDRDSLQLVDAHTQVYLMHTGITNIEAYDEAMVKEKMGLTPRQIPDYKALAGDASDNFPGVRGIGPVSAKRLVNEFGSVERLYEAIERGAAQSVSKPTLEKLSAGKEQAILSKKLAVIKTDLDLKIDDDSLKMRPRVTGEAEEFLTERGFKSLLKRAQEASQQTLL